MKLQPGDIVRILTGVEGLDEDGRALDQITEVFDGDQGHMKGEPGYVTKIYTSGPAYWREDLEFVARPLDPAKVRAAIHAHEDACIGLREGLSLGADAVVRCSTQVLRSRSALLALLGISDD